MANSGKHHKKKAANSETGDLPLFELLEPRVLYSADALGVGAALLPSDNSSANPDYISLSTDFVIPPSHLPDLIDHDPISLLPAPSHQALELIFIDSGISDINALVETWADTNVRFIVVNDGEDALERMTEVLIQTGSQGYGVGTVKIVSHGSSGSLSIGANAIDEATIQEREARLQTWASVLTKDADILLFGCNVGEGESGHSFVRTLAGLTGADVGASDDVTGNKQAGGDWQLEVSYGEIRQLDTSEIDSLASWQYTLAEINVSYLGDDISFNNNIVISDLINFSNVSLRMAVIAANNTAGDDTIKLTNNSGEYLVDVVAIGVDGSTGDLNIINDTNADITFNNTRSSTPTNFITVFNNATLSIDGDPNSQNHRIIFEGGVAREVGGAIRSGTGTVLNISGATFEGNSSNRFPSAFNLFGNHPGGAIYTSGELHVSNSSFIGNSAASGGAIYVADGGLLTVTDSVFENNETAPPASTLAQAVANYANNFGSGGAIYTLSDTTFSNTQFTDNTSSVKGGAVFSSDSLNISDSTFRQNSSGEDGGAIFSNNSLFVTGSHFELNSADNRGGAISAEKDFDVERSSFVGNSATTGSAIILQNVFFFPSTPSIDQVTFSNNVASGTGTVASASSLSVTSSTFVDNQAGANSAALAAVFGQQITVGSSIFLNNNVSGGAGENFLNVTSQGFNIFDTNTDANPDIDLVDTGLALEALTSIAGTQVATRPLPSGSSAINAGPTSPNSTDAQNQLIDSIPDIGASEFQEGSDGVYWADEDGNIWRAGSNFASPTLIANTTHTISGLVVDLNGYDNNGAGRLIWADQATGRINSLFLDGTGIFTGNTPQVHTTLAPGQINSLTYDQSRDHLFVVHEATVFNPPIIRVWELTEGGINFITQIENFDGYTLEDPRDVHFDPATARLYWLDGVPGTSNSTIHSSNADGSDYELIHISASINDDFNGLVTDDTGSFIYFTNQSDNTLNQLNLIDNTVSNSTQVNATGPGIGIADLTFLQNESEIAVTDSTNNQIHVYNDVLSSVSSPYGHSAAPVVIANASTAAANDPSFTVETIFYTEGDVAEAITDNHILIDDPSGNNGQNVTFTLISNPVLAGAVLMADGVTLTQGDSFDLSQNITYANDEITTQTTDSFQIQLFNNGVALPQIKAVTISLTPVDDPGTLTIDQITVIENTNTTTLSVNDFTFVDEETEHPFAYQLYSAPGTNPHNIVPQVNGADTTFFTHEQLELGLVTINASNAVLTQTGLTTPTIVPFTVVLTHANGTTVLLDPPIDPSSPPNFTIELIPQDDKATLTLQTSTIVINENSTQLFTTDLFQFNDEESVVDDVVYIVTDVGAIDFLTVTLNNTNLSVGDTFTHAQLANGDLEFDATHADLSNPDELTHFSFLAVTDLTDPSLASASDPLTLSFSIQQENDRPTVDVIAPLTGVVANENEITTIDASLFDYSDEENDALSHFEVISVTESDGFTHILNAILMNGTTALEAGDTFSAADLNAGLITINNTNLQLLSDDILLHITLRAVSIEDASHGITTTTQPNQNTTFSNNFVLAIDLVAQNDAPILTLNQPTIVVTEGNPPTVLNSNAFQYSDEESNPLSRYEVQPTSLPAGVTFESSTGPITNEITLAQLNSGEITINAENAIITDDTPISFILTLNAVDENGADSNSVDLTIEVTPTNDNPTVLTVTQFMSEDATLILSSDMFNFSDEETPNDAVYTLAVASHVSTSEFFINGVSQGRGSGVTFTQAELDSGQVIYSTQGADFPNGSNTLIEYGLTIELSDGTSTIFELFQIDLTPINEIPTLSFVPNDFTVNENFVTALPSEAFVVTDEENETPVSYTINSNLNNKPYTIEVNNNPLQQGDSFTHADLVAGNVDFNTSDADLTTAFADTLSITANMPTTPHSPPATLNITITPIDDEPALSPISTAINEGETIVLTPSEFNYTDEEDPQSATYTLTNLSPTGGAELIVDGISVGQSGNFTHQQLANGLVSFSTVNASYDVQTVNTLKYEVSAVTPTGQIVTNGNFDIIVTSQNDAPELSFITGGLSVDENSIVALPFSVFNLVDEENDTPLEYVINSDISASLFTLHTGNSSTPLALGDSFSHQDLINGNVFIDSVDESLSTVFTQSVFFTAIMAEGPSSAPAPLNISINPVDDAPTLSPVNITIDEGTLTQLTTISLGYDDEEGRDAHYLVNDIVASSGATLIVNGIVLSQGDIFEHQDLLDGNVFISTEDTIISNSLPTTTSFNLIAVPETGPASASADFVVTVNPTNDNPTVSPTSQLVLENSTLALDVSMFGYADEESDALNHLVIESSANALGVVLKLNGLPVVAGDIVTVNDLSNGLLILEASGANVNLSDSIALEFHAISDDGQRSESSVLSVTVIPDNDAAILTAQSGAIDIDEGTNVSLTAQSFVVQDEEGANVTAYVIQSLPVEPGVSVERNGVTLQVNDTFTQQDLNDGLININAINAAVLQSSVGVLNVFAQLDDGTQTNSADLLFNFIKVEDTPQLFITAPSPIPEDSTIILQSSQFEFSDTDGDTLVNYQLVSTLSTAGFSLQQNGSALNPGDTFTQADLDNGLLTLHSDGTNLINVQNDKFSVVAISSNGILSNQADVSVVLQPNDDAPTISVGDPIIANENELTTLTVDHFTVTDSENDTPTEYTLQSPLSDDVGTIKVEGSILGANESFSHDQLLAGNVQIDLQSLDITSDTVADFGLSVTAGGLTSTSENMSVQINNLNDAPVITLTTPLLLPALSLNNTVSIPENTFSDSDDDIITYTAVVAGDVVGTTQPLPNWLQFDSDAREFRLLQDTEATELDIIIIASDPNGSTAFTETVLTIENLPEPELAPALPEPIVLEVIEAPEPQVVQPEIVETAIEPEEETGEAELNTQSNSDTGIPTTDIESSRIDLASLLPSLSPASDETNVGSEQQTTDSILADLIGYTNDNDGSDPFSLSSFESESYQRNLDNLADHWDDDEELAEPALLNIDTTVGSSVGLSSGFTVGYMIWLLRGGTLMGSVLSSLPAWRLVDPLPVLAELDEGLDEDNESLETMVNRENTAREQTEATQANNQNAYH